LAGIRDNGCGGGEPTILLKEVLVLLMQDNVMGGVLQRRKGQKTT